MNILKDIDYFKNEKYEKNTIIKEYVIQNVYIYFINKEFYFFKKNKEDYIIISPFSFYEVDQENTYNILSLVISIIYYIIYNI